MGRLKFVAIAAAALVFLAVLFVSGQSRDSTSTIFHVTVPGGTPELDAVTLNLEGQVLPMQRSGDREYAIEVDTRDFEKGRPLRYGYVRGGFGNAFGEDIFIGNVGNRTFVPGVRENVVRDVVAEWKWLPAEPVSIAVRGRAGITQVAPREEFWFGPDLVDFWNGNFPLQYNSTIDHLGRTGYTWVQLDPPWDYRSVDPVIISGVDVQVPAWPEDELRREIRAFKAAGFKVYLGPQVCCAPVNFTGRSDAWWNGWYDQYERFVRFHADLAREEGVDAFSISIASPALPGAPEAPRFAEERIEAIIAVARESGAPIGYSYHILPPSDRPQLPWPQEAAALFDDVDFLSFGMWNHLSDEEFPTQAEIDAGFEPIFRDLEYAHNVSGKPVVLAQIAYFSKRGSAQQKGSEEFPTWEDPKRHLADYDARTQAMIYDSLMRNVARSPYVQGAFPFGYWYVESPLNLDSDIRAKPAEGIFAGWSKKISAATQESINIKRHN